MGIFGIRFFPCFCYYENAEAYSQCMCNLIKYSFPECLRHFTLPHATDSNSTCSTSSTSSLLGRGPHNVCPCSEIPVTPPVPRSDICFLSYLRCQLTAPQGDRVVLGLNPRCVPSLQDNSLPPPVV